jgi:hypothetical protein
MRFSWLILLPLVLGAAAPGVACSQRAAFDLEDPPGVPGPDATLAFDDEGTLELAPGALRDVGVTGSPPASYEVRFSLVGEAAGAFLDRTTVVADARGRASVELHAPSLASTFRLRATIKDGPSAEIGVAVSDKGFGTVRVVPLYEGHREVTEWIASVKAGTTCADIAAALPGEPEGALVASAPPDEPVVVKSAPVGPNLAVAIHAGQAAWGCADVADLQAGATRDVKVKVKDGPIDLAATSLDLTLAFTPTGEVSQLLAATTDRVVEALLPAGAEASTLLDAMELAAPPEQAPAFEEQRSLGQWDAAVAGHLGSLPVPLREACSGWADLGLSQQPSEITGYLGAISDVPGQAFLEVTAFGAIDAEDAGLPPEHLMSWTAEPGDVLRLVGDLFWIPSRFVGAAAWQGASAELPGAGSMGEALAEAAQCQALGAALGGYPGCDAACLGDLCAAALGERWQMALDASALAGLVGGIAVSASGAATVDEDASPIGWSAAWLGVLSDGEGDPVTVQGEASAVESQSGGPD